MADTVKCKCGSSLFTIITPIQFMDNEFMIWSNNDKLRPYFTSIQLAKCIRCDKIIIPSTSMMGKDHNSPEVKVYKELSECIKYYNDNIDTSLIFSFKEEKNEAFLKEVSSKIEEFKKDILDQCKKMEKKIEAIPYKNRNSLKKPKE